MFTLTYIGTGDGRQTTIDLKRVRYLLRAARSRGVQVCKSKGWRLITDCNVVLMPVMRPTKAQAKAAGSDKATYDATCFAIRHLRSSLHSLANRKAKENALWHDDPESDDHADFHAPAEEQFPAAMRDEVLLELVRFYVSETAQVQS